MGRKKVYRRSVIRGIGIGILGSGLAGQASADEDGNSRLVLGTKSQYGVDIARAQANTIETEIDFGESGNALVGDFPDELVEKFRAEGELRYVERDIEVHALGQSMPWGCVRVAADAAHQRGYDGSGAHVAILDTGIDSEHPDLSQNLGEGYAVVDSDRGDVPWNDDHNHGTHCAGIANAVNNDQGILGVSTRATLHSVKVLSGDGGGSASGVAEGIKWAADQGHDVISMSLGATSGSSIIKDAVEYAYERGSLLVGAAGNEGPCSDCVHYPGAYPEVIAVGSVNDEDELSEFSSTGPEVEIVAPGTEIRSTVIGGYQIYSGTSMATPHVAGAAAILMSTGISNEEARKRLTEAAEDIGLDEDEGGAGLLNVDAAISDGDDGGGDSDEFAVSTRSVSDVDETDATLIGELTGLGDVSSPAVGFEYWIEDQRDETSERVESGHQSSTGSFNADVSDLEHGTTYVFEAFAETDDRVVRGGRRAFTTDDDHEAPFRVETLEPSYVSDDAASLEGRVSELDGDEVETRFDYWIKGDKANTLASDDAEDVDEDDTFDELVHLESDTTYVAVAVCIDSGDEVTGGTVTFTTESD
ncbi:serine protease [Halogeometricum borinquense]|uniref:Serine protease n=1 Tax=Halogeometricum borinquense TaxID=60847 RepID=A0A482T270_9EURY|nr:S8 family peptidase [Halogeometricum borinquense]RYJ08122.1 serine protease [Halogeometricum borinquense]